MLVTNPRSYRPTMTHIKAIILMDFEFALEVPVVVRLEGTNVDQGKRILKEGIEARKVLIEAVLVIKAFSIKRGTLSSGAKLIQSFYPGHCFYGVYSFITTNNAGTDWTNAEF
ncbi:hypothetical protein VNO77_17441 [Canavalia gladiata]|uniref:Uncharacterized protein n=1 Tax=Canavalia gladiata TaxID=3824 RepID=A0AAN9QGM3_CANGL